MTISSWKKEFVPFSAKQASKFSVVRMLELALMKWIGLRQKNLKKHDLVVRTKYLYVVYLEDDFGAYYCVDSDNCSLCLRFIDRDGCGSCPLVRTKGGVSFPCDKDDGREPAPYSSFMYCNDPEPMIRLIRNALKKERKRFGERRGR